MNIPAGLKATIIYFVVYGLITELFVINHWSEWSANVAGTSLGYTLGYFMKGPLLGILFLYSAYLLSKKQVTGRKLAVVCLLFAALTDIHSFAWGFAGGAPSSNVLLISGAIFLSWSAIWFYLLFKKTTSEVLH